MALAMMMMLVVVKQTCNILILVLMLILKGDAHTGGEIEAIEMEKSYHY